MNITPISSPCINECELNSKNICKGCQRTLTEISNWSRITSEERKEIRDRITQDSKL